ncbi:DUF2188 domain-containing protein [Dawidia soli]|uniref:DUF2188 domain-containing protein n=1 Tax=Dawidia soli TaxID=2782352 RepID=A0AAP2GFX3_9BACT|nr:DUF2188 domain-containing protein [Dawidia soli]MBT1689929.1 DUF2188 domain-containing protein [Dawidia soli]
MPWNKTNYPPSMKNLPAAVRNKAVEIANALLAGTDMPEGIAIATATSRAKDWAANRGKDTESHAPESRPTDVKEHGEDRYVIPYHGDQWAVKKERSEKVEKVFDKKADAVKLGRREAKDANAALTVQKKTGKLQKRTSYNPNKRGRKQS